MALLVATSACGGGEPAPARRERLRVWVLDEGLVAGAPRAPLADVEVDFDPPGGGERVVSRTAADGHADFEADFSAGAAAVTVVSRDHVIYSALGASPASARARQADPMRPGDLVLVVPRLDAVVAGTIGVRGAIAGKRAESSVDVSASGLVRLGSTITREPSYALRAPSGRPFFLLAHEVVSTDGVNELTQSVRIDAPALSADATVNVDFAAQPPLPRRTLRARAPLPTGGPFRADAACSATVHAADSSLLAGIFRRAENDGAACEVEMTVAETDVAPETLLTTGVLVAPDGSRSERTEVGVVPDGASLDGFLIPPVVAEASRSVRDPIAIGGLPAGADVRVDVFAAGQLLWILTGPPGGLAEGVLRMPRPPVRFSADVVLLAIAITARLDPVTLPSGTVVHRRAATSRDVVVRR